MITFEVGLRKAMATTEEWESVDIDALTIVSGPWVREDEIWMPLVWVSRRDWGCCGPIEARSDPSLHDVCVCARESGVVLASLVGNVTWYLRDRSAHA